jgi:hypothetical protein
VLRKVSRERFGRRFLREVQTAVPFAIPSVHVERGVHVAAADQLVAVLLVDEVLVVGLLDAV